MSRTEKARIRDYYNREAPRVATRHHFARRRSALLADARGRTLEVAAGAGANLDHYPPGVELVLADLSTGLLLQACRRAAQLGRQADLVVADAEQLPFPSGVFDTTVVTLALCTVPDPGLALAELRRVSRPGAAALFLEHGPSPHWWVRRLQPLLQLRRRWRWCGCRWDRDPASALRAAGFILERERSGPLGIFRQLWARVPTGEESPSAPLRP